MGEGPHAVRTAIAAKIKRLMGRRVAGPVAPARHSRPAHTFVALAVTVPTNDRPRVGRTWKHSRPPRPGFGCACDVRFTFDFERRVVHNLVQEPSDALILGVFRVGEAS